MQQVIVRFLARSGAYLGLPKEVIASVIDELLEREWVKYQPIGPFDTPIARPKTPLPQPYA
jgi:hypothetical protein